MSSTTRNNLTFFFFSVAGTVPAWIWSSAAVVVGTAEEDDDPPTSSQNSDLEITSMLLSFNLPPNFNRILGMASEVEEMEAVELDELALRWSSASTSTTISAAAVGGCCSSCGCRVGSLPSTEASNFPKIKFKKNCGKSLLSAFNMTEGRHPPSPWVPRQTKPSVVLPPESRFLGIPWVDKTQNLAFLGPPLL